EVGHGDATADIVAGESTTVQIMILPSVGSGDLNITIQWKKQLFTSEEIVASVIPDLGGSSSLPFSPIDEDGAYHFSTCSLYGVDAGYYLVILQLIGDGQQVWGIAEAVVIFAGAATSHTYTYTQK
ncbi:MAG: hypothetical protein JXB06_08525, partial [Spirochaetales bacterium]|nr:hypothetical protein [Spirochaetales bacterium]